MLFSLSLLLAGIPLLEENAFKSNPAYQEGIKIAHQLIKEAKESKPCCQASSYLQEMAKSKKGEEILIFVSFSMPQEVLKNLNQDAQKYAATLILKGLVDNSFKQTVAKLKDFPSSVEIDPSAFEKYHITKVPTFIRVREGKEVARLSGNVTLSFAAQKLREQEGGAS